MKYYFTLFCLSLFFSLFGQDTIQGPLIVVVNNSTTGALNVGENNLNNSNFTFTMGSQVETSAWGAVSMGYLSKASGQMSFVQGYGAEATGYTSMSVGTWAKALHDYSQAFGKSTTASGQVSTAFGEGTKAEAQFSMAIGRWNVGGGTAGSWITTDPLFEIGNGSNNTNRSNALTVLKNGKIGVGTASPGNYDLNVNGYLNVEQGARFGCNTCGDYTNLFGSYGWGILTIQGRVLSSSDNLHLSPANGKKVIINDTYRAAGGGGNGSAGLDVEGETWLASGSGAVGVGTTTIPSGYKLAVNGAIIATEVKVEATPWPDYVFADDYSLKSLEETETYIKENKRLPDMPSAAEVAENGIALGEINRLLVEKVEQMTLHLIEQDKLIQRILLQLEGPEKISDKKTVD